MNGRLMKTLADEQMQQGIHQLTWNTTNKKGDVAGPGIYFLRIDTKNYSETKKLVVMK